MTFNQKCSVTTIAYTVHQIHFQPGISRIPLRDPAGNSRRSLDAPQTL